MADKVPYIIAERGNSHHTLGPHGLLYEVVGPGQDGGPCAIAACYTKQDALRVIAGLKLIDEQRPDTEAEDEEREDMERQDQVNRAASTHFATLSGA